MHCYYCENEACAKIGTSKGNIIAAFFGAKCWNKKEIYVCKKCYDKRTGD